MLRLQLELSQAKGDLERRLQEKEEEMEAARYLKVNTSLILFDTLMYLFFTLSSISLPSIYKIIVLFLWR